MPTRITKPIRPGTVIRFEGQASPTVPPSVAETVAIPITHDWGPVDRPVLCQSFPEFEAQFGASRTLGRDAILGAFAGQALPGQGGAGAVYVYRMAVSSLPAKAAVSTALDVLAKHPGTAGNLLTVFIENDPYDSTNKQQCRVLLNGAQVERYNYTKASPQELVNAIAQRSNYINAALGGVKATTSGITAQARLVSGNTVGVDISGATKPMLINWGDGTPPTTESEPNAGGQHTYTTTGSKSVVITSPDTVPISITLPVVLPWPAATALANTAAGGTALTGGTSGDTGLILADWLKALTALEYLPFSVLAPYDLEGTAAADITSRAGIVSWVQGQEAANRPVVLVLGGGSGETVDQAVTNARAINDHHVVRLAGGFFADDVLGSSVSTSRLAPRVAGMLASLGDANSLTFKSLGGLSYVGQGFANDQIETAIQNGVTTVSVSTNPVAPLRIERGLTTFVTDTDPTRPRDFFSDPRLVRLVDLFIRRMKIWGDETLIGNVPVNDDSRSALRAHARAEIDDLMDRGLIIPGTDFLEVPVPTDPEYLDSLIYEFGFQCARTALYIFGFGTVR